MEKICNKCRTSYPITPEFFYRKGDGFNLTWCKQCHNAAGKKARDKYARNNRDKVVACKRRYKLTHTQSIREYARAYAVSHVEQIRQKHRRYAETHRQQNNEKAKRFRVRHDVRLKMGLRNRRQTDIGFKILCNLRKTLHRAVKRCEGTKSARTLQLLGCSTDQLKRHLESKFVTGMTWNNYGKKWHIDHIIPCAAFDLTNGEQQKECFGWKNIQPLWAHENMKKNSFHNGQHYRRTQHAFDHYPRI